LNLIPVEYYTLIYYNLLLFVVVLFYVQATQLAIDDPLNLRNKRNWGNVLALLIILYIGLRPISGRYFGDMRTYAGIFERYAAGEAVRTGKDVYFEHFMKWCSSVMSVETFFFICALLYVLPLYFAAKKLFAEYWFYAFMMLVVSMSFWAYGTNGIRNGIGTSLFILAISFPDKKIRIAIFLLALLFHQSILIPILAYLLALFHKKPKHFLIFWFLSIPLSAVLGGFWESFFLDFGFGETDRLLGYLGDEENDFQEQFSSVGFRWDFVLYSATGVFAGWYYIFKKKFEDPFYATLYSTYLIANSFWILIIRATFSNRFSYLSWFMLGIIIIYPLLINKFFPKQHLVVVRILLIYFLFTYFINLVFA
jgi:hypothetical protein